MARTGFGVDGIRLRCYIAMAEHGSGGRNVDARKARLAGKSRSGMPKGMAN
jgi:hypothetical protein